MSKERAGAGARILVVDDEPAILRVVRVNLSRHEFHVATAGTAREALEQYTAHHPDLVLLDLGLPDKDGFTVIEQIRERASTPIIVLSAREAERDKVRALDMGADDHLTKPFGVDELLARVRVALRHLARLSDGKSTKLRADDLEVDLERRRVLVAGQEVHLTPTEYELLKALITHPNKVLTTRMLLGWVWGDQYGAGDHYLHVYIARLRKKLATSPDGPRYLITESGIGYRFLMPEG
jgi:two-component system KDP operon response regulator KdpE